MEKIQRSPPGICCLNVKSNDHHLVFVFWMRCSKLSSSPFTGANLDSFHQQMIYDLVEYQELMLNTKSLVLPHTTLLLHPLPPQPPVALSALPSPEADENALQLAPLTNQQHLTSEKATLDLRSLGEKSKIYPLEVRSKGCGKKEVWNGNPGKKTCSIEQFMGMQWEFHEDFIGSS